MREGSWARCSEPNLRLHRDALDSQTDSSPPARAAPCPGCGNNGTSPVSSSEGLGMMMPSRQTPRASAADAPHKEVTQLAPNSEFPW